MITKKKKYTKAQCRLDIQNIYDLEPDRWGNYKFVNPAGRVVRIKLAKISWRMDIKSGDRWIKKAGSYFGNPDCFAALKHAIMINKFD